MEAMYRCQATPGCVAWIYNPATGESWNSKATPSSVKTTSAQGTSGYRVLGGIQCSYAYPCVYNGYDLLYSSEWTPVGERESVADHNDSNEHHTSTCIQVCVYIWHNLPSQWQLLTIWPQSAAWDMTPIHMLISIHYCRWMADNISDNIFVAPSKNSWKFR